MLDEHRVTLVSRILCLVMSIGFMITVSYWFLSDAPAQDPDKLGAMWFLLILLGGPIAYFFVSHGAKFEFTWSRFGFVVGGGYAVAFAAFAMVRWSPERSLCAWSLDFGEYEEQVALDYVHPQEAFVCTEQNPLRVIGNRDGPVECSFMIHSGLGNQRRPLQFDARLRKPAGGLIHLAEDIRGVLARMEDSSSPDGGS